MKKKICVIVLITIWAHVAQAQEKSTIKEYNKTFITYPFSDPDPIPEPGKIYPYYRFDGYTDKPVQKEWKVVELENDYIKLMILPEVGGKIWSAIEKSTGKSFIYFNQVVKFRDVAMRGPWTSGGIEANYGIIGHTPNCATPVDYVTMNKNDGSVSCIIGVLDLLTRTWWRIDINLPKDKAYFTTSSYWYNASPLEQPYYTWMNTGLKAAGNLQFIYPGTKYLGHSGEFSDWPINKENGKDISYYDNNNFGEYKSYHVFGKYTDFFGGYWHDEDFGMGRYSSHDDKPGKKIWIWGLSQQGMIWEKLLTDKDGQYVEVQSGRMFNQAAEGSTLTPFKHTGFLPHTSDVWTEYWFPVLKTKGFVAANNYGALNIKKENNQIKIYFSPLETIHDKLEIREGDHVIYSKELNLKPLQLFSDSTQLKSNATNLLVTIGGNKLEYDAKPLANNLGRPVAAPRNFNWKSVQGLYLQGKEYMRQRMYVDAEEKLRDCLEADPNFIPALADLAMQLFRRMQYDEALTYAKKALAIDTYDPASNYYYGLINEKLGNIADAKDGFDLASLNMEYRSASYVELAKLYFKEHNTRKSIEYCTKAIDFNKYAADAYQLLAVIYRLDQNKEQAVNITNELLQMDPLNHFANYERSMVQNAGDIGKTFSALVKNEMPAETFLELASWYYHLGLENDAVRILQQSPINAENLYWQAFLLNKNPETKDLNPAMVFPFRPETAEILEQLIKNNNHWLLKYHLALINWSFNNRSKAKELFEQCKNEPNYAPFYAARSAFYANTDSSLARMDMEHAADLDKNEWRYGRSLTNYYLGQNQPTRAEAIARTYYARFPENYILGMSYANTLLKNKKYQEVNLLLQKIKILPNEGATNGRQLYKEVKLMLAVQEMQKKNYKKALTHLTAGRQWPLNLGVGKPYDQDIDERLEDWLTYESFIKSGNKKAGQQMLDKINAYTDQIKQQGYFPSTNNLISAWALQKIGKAEDAQKLLKEIIDKNPSDATNQWVMNAYNGNISSLTAGRSNENYRILEEWMQWSKQPVTFIENKSAPVFTWPDGKKVAISLTFDDARTSQVEGGTALLDEYGVKATFFVVPSGVEKKLDGWKQAVAKGHEIGNHTLNHPCSGNFAWSRTKALEDYTLDGMRQELEKCNQRIEELLGVKAKVFAYPCGQKFVGRAENAQSVVPMVSELFLLGRGWLDEAPNDPTYCDFAQLMGIEMDGKNFEEILPLIEDAKNKGLWLVFGGHEMGEGGVQTIQLSMLKKLLEYAKDPANGVWIAPAGTVATYVKQHRK